MEIARSYLAGYATGFAAYLALEVALMRRYVARGGSQEEFCTRLAPTFRRRFAPMLEEAPGRPDVVPLLPATPRLKQEALRRAA